MKARLLGKGVVVFWVFFIRPVLCRSDSAALPHLRSLLQRAYSKAEEGVKESGKDEWRCRKASV